MDPITILGVCGASIILIFFLLNQLKVLSVESIWYDSANLLGSGMLIIYAYLIGSLPFIILNVVWFLFSFKDVVAYWTRKESPLSVDK
ncbi:MAG: hypothetical protein ACJKTH_01695 [Patescibacteria group bacterium UBA2163]